MNVLRALVSPERKRAKTHEIHIGDSDEDPDVEEEEHDAEEMVTEHVIFNKKMENMLYDLRARVQQLEQDIGHMKPEISQAKLNIDLAQAEADEANVQAGMAHAASEEAANTVADLRYKTTEIEAALVKREEVSIIVQGAIDKMSSAITATAPNGSARPPSSEQIEKFSRTAVVGGFEQGSMKNEIEHDVKELLKDERGVEEVYAYRRGSIGFIRFSSSGEMWAFLKKVNAKGVDRPMRRGRSLWISASRTPEDRRKGKALYSSKRVLIEVGLAKEEDVDFEAKRGVLWIGRQRVAEWVAATEKLRWKPEALKAAGVDVDSKLLDAAIDEKINMTK